ncbi:eukaryotic translation initiation factor 4B-like isoform X2 [Mya arenaria]|uniref:eukaryotic translation initiation factor 4B-like isoform X2 n=1 Tax=Mya arenaria TaxID=6604 RepID=UPI0022E6A63F|nr:eukaryotic translation initiation factor 4B-like isoform X2 [Mya arenaria]
MAAKAKKDKKKGKTMALTDFLSDEAGNQQGPGASYVFSSKSTDWAAEMDNADMADIDPAYSLPSIDRTKLPTAPKAARGPEDMSRVPTDPPFTAFVGNLPYEASEEKLMVFFEQLDPDNVRLPDDNGRMRGFGYVQFKTRQGLIDALGMNEEVFGGRKIRVDLAGESQNDNRKGGGRDDGGPDRTEGDWRSQPKSDSAYSDRGNYGRSDDRGPSRYDDRGPSRDDRGPARYEDRGFGGDRRSDRGGDYGGFGRREDRGFGGGRDRNDDDRRGGFGGGGNRDDGGRGFGSGFRRDDEGRDGGGAWERQTYQPRADQGYDRNRRDGGGGGGFDRDRRDGGGGGGFDRDRRDGGGGGGFDRDRRDGGGGGGFDRDRRDGGGGGGFEREREERTDSREQEVPKERPRLNLQPRTKPAEVIDNQKAKQPPPQRSSASIFGSAKPVDTAQREREIEERMMRQKQEPAEKKSSLESRGYGSSRGYEDTRERRTESHTDHDKESRNLSRPEGGRRRSGSDRSEDGDARRERRSSGSSKKKEITSPAGSVTSSSGRSRQASGDPSHTEVFTESEVGKGQGSPGNAHQEEAAKLVPAPPPKENIWEKRKITQQPGQSAPEPRSPPAGPISPSAEPRSPPAGSKAETKSPAQPQPSSTSAPPRQQAKAEASPNKPEGKKEFVAAGPPKENVWAKRKQEQVVTAKPSPSGPEPTTAPPSVPPGPAGVPNAWAGRGRGAERGRAPRGGGGYGRGRGAEQPRKTEKKEKPLPQSIDEMPKLEQKSTKVFVDSNKFAGLLDDEDEEET